MSYTMFFNMSENMAKISFLSKWITIMRSKKRPEDLTDTSRQRDHHFFKSKNVFTISKVILIRIWKVPSIAPLGVTSMLLLII